MNFDVKSEQRAYIKFCVELGRTPVQTKDLLRQTTCGRNVSRALVYRWHKRFSENISNQSGGKGAGRPAVITEKLTSEVLEAVRDDSRQTVRDISVQFDIGTATAHKILKEHLNMERICARWVPRLLTSDDRKRRVNASRSFLKKFKDEGEGFLDRIITTDETWLHYYDPETKQQSSMWKVKGSAPPKKAKVCRSSGKHMCIMFMDRRGILLIHFVPEKQTGNSSYYSKVLRRDLINAIRKKRPELFGQMDKILFRQDNAPAHTAVNTQIEIDLLGFEQLHHPPYSPDLAPMDFAVFPRIKAQLRGIKFRDFSELKRATLNAVKSLDNDWCSSVYDKWVARHEKCILLDGVYFEKE